MRTNNNILALLAVVAAMLVAPVAQGQYGGSNGGSGRGFTPGGGASYRALQQQAATQRALNRSSITRNNGGRFDPSGQSGALVRNGLPSRRGTNAVGRTQTNVAQTRNTASERSIQRNNAAATASRTLRAAGSGRWTLGSGPQALALNRTSVRNVLEGAQDDEAAERAHGVFDSGRRGALGVVGEAWQRAQRGGAGVAVTRGRNGSLVYTVAMGRRVGYIGGRDGARMGRPEAQAVRLVVRNGTLLTAYPHNEGGAHDAPGGAGTERGGAHGSAFDMDMGEEHGGGHADFGGDHGGLDDAHGIGGPRMDALTDTTPATLDFDDRSMHLLDRQLADDTSLDRMHGVFDGGREGALGAVHEAWDRVRLGDQSVSTRPGRSEGSTVYRVPMGREVGFVGGARGAQLGNPRANVVELVVRRGRLMTAYPVANQRGSTVGGTSGANTVLGRGAIATANGRTAALNAGRQQQQGALARTNAGRTNANVTASATEGEGGVHGDLDITERAMGGVMARTVDNPEADRFHTVFAGGRDGAVATINEAWDKVRSGSGEFEERPGREAGTTVYRVDLGRDVGFVGGREGREQGNPTANGVDLVVRGRQLIAAYPIRQTQVMGERLRLEARTLRIPSRPATGHELVTGRSEERAHPERQLTVAQLRDRLISRARDSSNRPIQPARAEGGAQHLAYVGLPSDEDGDTGSNNNDRLIVSRDSVISYNAERRVLNWEAWTMSEDRFGDAPRTDAVRTNGTAWERARVQGLDPRLPRDTPQADNDDYSRSGYHRGHIRDSGAFTATTAMNARTYTLTNAVPQSPGSNLGAWNGFENYLRHIVREGNVINVVSGPLFRGQPQTIGQNRVAVPTALWKIAIINPRGTAPGTINANTRIISAIFPNTHAEAHRDQSWTDFRTTPRIIERQTGLRFFTNMPQNTAEHLRDTQDHENVPEELRLLRSHGNTVNAQPGR